MKNILFIVANNWYQDYEFWVSYLILSDKWHHCEIASWNWWVCKWVFWRQIDDSMKLDDVNVDNYDLLIFVWGGGAYEQYYKNEKYLELAKQAKNVAAICIAPSILSDSWIYQWKRVTWWDDWKGTQISYLENNGAIFVSQEVVRDWNYITGNWPEAATKFAWEIVDFLNELEN